MVGDMEIPILLSIFPLSTIWISGGDCTSEGSHDSFLASLLDFVISSEKKKRLVGGIRYTYPSEKYDFVSWDALRMW